MRCCLPVVVVLMLPLHLAALYQAEKVHRARSANSTDGVVIENVPATSPARKAGVRKGDVLIAWSRGAATGNLTSTFDLSEVAQERASRGEVRLEGFRGGIRRRWIVNGEPWGMKVRPLLPKLMVISYLTATKAGERGEIERAIEMFENLANTAPLQKTALSPWFLMKAARLAASSGDKPKTDKLYQSAIDYAEKAEPQVRAALLYEWGSTFETRDDLIQAGICYERMLAEYQKRSIESVSVAAGLTDLSAIDLKQGNATLALTKLRRAQSILEKLAPSGLLYAVTLMDLGVLAQQEGDLAEAANFYRKSISIEESRAPHSTDLAISLSNLGTLEHQRGDFVSAKTYHLRALHVLSGQPENSLENAKVLENLADSFNAQGMLKKAESYERRVLAIRNKIAPASLAVSQSLIDLGKIASANHDLAKAETYYREAQSIIEQLTPLPPEAADVFIALAELASDRKDWSLAERQYRRALSMTAELFPSGMDHAEALAALAKILARKGDWVESSRYYDLAINALESRTARLGGGNVLRAGFNGLHMNVYGEYVGVLVSLNKDQEAFEILERSKARLLLETLSRASIDLHKGINSNVLEKKKGIQADISAKAQLLFGLQETPERQDRRQHLEREMAQLKTKLEAVEEQQFSENHSYASLVRPKIFSHMDVQKQLLDADTVLLSYSLGEERSFVFAVTSAEMHCYQLPPKSIIDKAAHRLYEILTSHNRAPNGESSQQKSLRWRKAENEYPRAALELSRLILEPVSAQLGKQRVLIVADGSLEYIPFAALPTPGSSPTSDQSSKLSPMILEHEVVNLPSASTLGQLRQAVSNKNRPSQDLVIFADPVFDSNDPRILVRTLHAGSNDSVAITARNTKAIPLLQRMIRSKVISPADPNPFPRLLYSLREANQVTNKFPPGHSLRATGFAATRELAMSPKLSQYRVVHFATHGMMNSDQPELSGLVLSLVDRNGRPQNGFLGLGDIYNMDLSADLVVLSACETALGKNIAGEGLIGVTRGFMYAGSPRVVASLWKVSDIATAEFMREFYQGMESKHLSPAKALQSATNQMRSSKRWQSPYFWAAFVIQGEYR